MKMPILISVIACLAVLPGCYQIEGWERDHFYQGAKYFPNIDDPQTPINIVKRNMRTMRVYDEFGTLGIFDALWLNDEVRQVYIDLHARRMGLSPEMEQQLLRRQMAEQQDALSFFVIAYAPNTTMPLDEEGNAPWTIFLKTPVGQLRPLSIRIVELSVEYKYVLSNYLSKHKTVYLVRFDPWDGPFELEFKYTDRHACVSWERPAVPPPPESKTCTKIKPEEEECVTGRPAIARVSKELVV